MKRFFVILLVSLVILIIVLLLLWNNDSAGYKVYTEKVTRRTIVQTVSASGKIQPEKNLKITSDVSGEITELYVKEGQKIRKGDLICRIRPDLYISSVERSEALVKGTASGLESSKAQLKQAKANLELAEANFQRMKKLFEKEIISRQEFDNAKTQYESALANYQALESQVNSSRYTVLSNEASLKEAKTNLERTFIYAPVDGTIYKLNVEKGERVQGVQGFQGTEILRMADLNEMQVVVDVNENDILKIHKGDSALIEVDARPGRIFKGLVTEVGTSANTGSLSTDQAANYQVKIRILKESYSDLISSDGTYPFLPGMSASVEIMTQRAENVLSVPVQAVTVRPEKTKTTSSKPSTSSEGDEDEMKVTENAGTEKNKKMQEVVFVIRNKKAVKVNVETGIQDMEYIEIRKGLKEGDEVIAGPYSLVSRILKGDESVTVVSEEEALFKAEEK
jgi:HlyD family secretion protein